MSQAIESAVANLLACCDGASKVDGAGFNKFDSVFARDLHNKKPWSPKQLWAMWRMLQKYRKQLSGMGVDLAAIPAPPDPSTAAGALAVSTAPTPYPSAASFNAKGPSADFSVSAQGYKEALASKPQPVSVVWITLQEDGVVAIYFPWSETMVALVRQIPGRTWDGLNKRWLVVVDDLSAEALRRFAEQAKTTLPEGLATWILKSRAERKAAEESARAGMADSLATDADFDIEGLGGVLMPFQRAGAKYMAKSKRCVNADEMGLGKTVQALATLFHLKALPGLVVCPASLRLNWIREALKWMPNLYPSLYEQNAYSDLGVINYDVLSKHKDHILDLIERGRIRSVTFDEFHYLKNHKALRSVAARHIAAAIVKKYGDDAVVLGLTGTPVLNRPGELLHLLQVLGRLDEVGGFKVFRDRYLSGDWKSRGEHLQELQQILRSRFLIRREKSQVLKDLPAKRRVYIDMPMASLSAYKAVEDKPLEDHEAAAMVRIGELRRECARQKLPAVLEWVEEFLDTDKKLILFAAHKDIQSALIEAFPGCVHILGEDDAVSRQRAVDKFQEDPKVRLIVLSLKAGGVGLTLTAASDVAFVEFGWTPGDMDQAEDRAHRIGQKDSVTAWYLRAPVPEGKSNIDGDMLALIDEKRDVSDRLLSEGRAGEADPEQVKGRLVTAMLAKARKEGRLVPKKVEA